MIFCCGAIGGSRKGSRMVVSYVVALLQKLVEYVHDACGAIKGLYGHFI